MAADGKNPPTHPQGGGGNIMCTCSIFVCRHKNNDMSTLLGHAHTYIPTDRQSDTQAYIHKSIQTYSYTYTWLHMCDVSPLWGGGWGGTRGGWIIYIYILIYNCMICKQDFYFFGGDFYQDEVLQVFGGQMNPPILTCAHIFKGKWDECWGAPAGCVGKKWIFTYSKNILNQRVNKNGGILFTLELATNLWK